MGLRLAACVVVPAALLTFLGVERALPAEPGSPLSPSFEGGAHVVNGVMTPLYPAVGVLLAGSDPDRAGAWCTGTLIGCRTFLTAAHCVCPENGKACQSESAADPADYLVFFQHAGFHRLASIEVHPDYVFPTADLAVITLAAPVTGVAPLPINTAGAPEEGERGIIVGFGRSGGDRFDYGLKRSGAVSITRPSGGASGLIWWFFKAPMGEPGSSSNTCNGDSGGPLLLPSSDGLVVAGVTSGGHAPDCLVDDSSFDIDVSSYAEWISSRIAPAIDGSPCGGLQPVGEAQTAAFSVAGELNELHPLEQHEVSVPMGSTILRIGLNAIGDGESDFNLHARPKAADPVAAAACRLDGPGQYGFCELSAPVAGPWEVHVERVAGAGPYQVTVTTFATGNPVGEESPCGGGGPCTPDDPWFQDACPETAGRNSVLCPYQRPPTCPTVPDPRCMISPAQARTSLAWRQRGDGGTLTWRWSGRAPGNTRFDPTADGAYFLCVYEQGVDWHLLLDAAIPTGAGWRGPPRGFKYHRGQTGGGVTRARLRSGRHGRAGILIEMSDVRVGEPLALDEQSGGITVQFHHDAGCWESRH
jgi:hypothetical protein